MSRHRIGLALVCAAFVALAARAGAAAPEGGDPFAYCARVGTIDKPADGFTPTPVPQSLAPAIRASFGLAADAPLMPEFYYWRCMDRSVYVCAVGANIPCGAKADLAKRSRGADSYCRDNPNAGFVPAYATGHETIYAWKCSAGRSVRTGRTGKLDRRGYQVNFWYRLRAS